jgi:hypothetical protein
VEARRCKQNSSADREGNWNTVFRQNVIRLLDSEIAGPWKCTVLDFRMSAVETFDSAIRELLWLLSKMNRR